jgi:hypothetical protein
VLFLFLHSCVEVRALIIRPIFVALYATVRFTAHRSEILCIRQFAGQGSCWEAQYAFGLSCELAWRFRNWTQFDAGSRWEERAEF